VQPAFYFKDSYRLPVRVIRFLLLLVVLAVVFIATPTFGLQPFASLLPADFFADSLLLQQFRLWVMTDVARYSLLLTSCAALTFGLLAVPWPFDAPRTYPSSAHSQTTAPLAKRAYRRWWGLLLLLGAIAGTITLLFWPQLRVENWINHLLWVGAILLLLCASALLTPLSARRTVQKTAGDQRSALRYRIGWRPLGLLLLLVLLLYGWKLTSLPPVVDEQVASVGLQGLAMARGEQATLFTIEPTISLPDNQQFHLSLVPTALLIWLTGDLLLSTRIVGLLAVFLLVGATWLVALELFTRRPSEPNAFRPIEDNGRTMMLVATVLVITHIAVLYYSRHPMLLGAVGWGTMGCWALLRGMRTADRLAIALSGVLLGLSALSHGSAITFLLTALLWWIGFGAAQLGWLPHLARTGRAAHLHGGDFLLWLLGFGVVSAPFVTVRISEVFRWFGQLPTAAGGMIALLDQFSPPIATYPAPFYHPLFLPFVPLILGVLLFNLDRRVGWMISSWIGIGLFVAAFLPAQGLRWEMLLPLIPALALALAFTFDRLQVTLIRVGGRWLQQYLSYLLLGLLLWSGFQNVTTYYGSLLRERDALSTIGYALRALPAEQPVLIYLPPEQELLPPFEPQLAPQFTMGAEIGEGGVPLAFRFLTNDTLGAERDAAGDADSDRVRVVTTLPSTLAPGTTVLFFLDNPTILHSATLTHLRGIYPTGQLTVQRDIFANPLLLRYTAQIERP